MNLKTILIITMILLSVSLCGCLEDRLVETKEMKVIKYSPDRCELLCVDNETHEYHTLYFIPVNKYDIERGEARSSHPDRLFESDSNIAYVNYYVINNVSDSGFVQTSAFINSSVFVYIDTDEIGIV